ncbi:hypothetical protein B0T18DRAFT_317391 [Schizothecium vesticola]|uniref:DUF7707 domain-containing protein n=1 Tax=Schizothecium vesticola TaxID=314040 RepID=A0AA40KAJ6_9PEZI|nr:hypothetical protein B0T18DRAFT_317391 [Schizothecium vesticola]
MRQSSIVVALSAVSVAVAQNFTVNPTDVDLTTRTQWCNAEFNTCGILCGGTFNDNSCTPNDLKFTCTCTNGTAPGLEYYIQTMPTFICQKAFEQCTAKNTGDSIAQNKCTTDIRAKCGTLDPSKANIPAAGGDEPSPTAAPSPSATGGSQAGAGGNAPATTSSTAAGPTMIAQIGNGLAVVAAGVFAAALL